MLDYLLDFTDDEEIQFADSMCFAVAGYHTLAYCKLRYIFLGFIEWIDGILAILRPFQQYFSHVRTIGE